MRKVKKDKDFIRTPYFEGGRLAMDAFVKKHLIYPEEAKRAGIEGRVTIQYEVDYKGKIIHTRIITGLGFGCDEEALRIVKMFPFKVPEGDGKIKSKYSRKVHIHFHLHKKPKEGTNPPQPVTEPSAPNPVIQYQYVTPTASKSNSGGNYQYTITFQPEGEKKS